MQFVRNTTLALATGYVLFFFSERVFWSAFRPGDHAGELAVTWLAYSVIAYPFLSVVRRFRATSAPGVYLAGAFFGWLTEGTLVGTLYGTESSAPFPLSLLVTGVSWHALISVWVGWHFLRRALRHATPWHALGWSAALGVFWGTWATFLWRESPPVVVPVGAFASHAFVVAALLVVAYGLIDRFGADSFRPRPFGLCVSVLLLGVFYVQQVRVLGVRPLVVLPAVLGLAALALWRASLHPSVPPQATTTPPLRRVNLLAPLVMPVAATAVYATLLEVPWWSRVPVPVIVFYGLTAPLSAAVLLWALVRSFRRCRSAPPAACLPA